MKKHILFSLKIGLMASGGGPLIIAIVYCFLFGLDKVSTISLKTVIIEIISSLILAFIAGAVSVVYQIEKLPLMFATLIHSFLLFLDYFIIYVANGWIELNTFSILCFCGIYVLIYSVIWSSVQISLKQNIKRLNKSINS